MFSGNVATEEGGALHLTEAPEAHMVEVDFSANVALSNGNAGGAAYCGTFATLKTFGCTFFGNAAPEGKGGAVMATAETVNK